MFFQPIPTMHGEDVALRCLACLRVKLDSYVNDTQSWSTAAWIIKPKSIPMTEAEQEPFMIKGQFALPTKPHN